MLASVLVVKAVMIGLAGSDFAKDVFFVALLGLFTFKTSHSGLDGEALAAALKRYWVFCPGGAGVSMCEALKINHIFGDI